MQNFELIKVIGQGSYSLVYEVRRKLDNKVYALKKVKLSCLSQQEKINCLNEIRLLARLSHPNIIQYKQAFFEDDHLCLITQYADQGDFLQFLVNRKKKKNPLTEEQFCIYARQMANGLNGLHKTNILHRDVKAANFFIVGEKVKIGDMNVSSISKDGMALTKIGTPYYTSPQIWKQQPYSFKSDIWALGCLFYEAITFLHPFTGRDVSQLKENVLKHDFVPLPESVSSEIVEIITSCLKKDPRERPTSQQLLRNQYMRQKYNEYRQKTMEKSLLNEKQHKQTCFRILREITSGSCEIKKALLPKSNYLSIQKCQKQESSYREDSSKPKKKNESLSKKLTNRLLTMYNIYHQKPPMALRKGNKAIQIR